MNQLSSPGKQDPNDYYNRGDRYINSSPIISNKYSHDINEEDDDSNDGDSDEDIIDKITRNRQEKANLIYRPMSSPIRGEQRSSKGGFKSKSLRSKYTLRTRQYIPFKQRQLQERTNKRDELQLLRRGGMDEMEKFIQARGEQEDLKNLNEESNNHIFEFEELNESNDTLNKYEQELEDMLRREEEELEQLTSNLTLDQQ
ncbi:hypothetical protein BN7_5192 [Wickerhamomyces ciferrii]|uniref:Uncharacterized protein n=1 Tax=Wickerhamomyces ciferrii (strain ATCC 14091 / BCRC 22168 / CBS 111 / JCM 3599 / NBRC 0793 / NRRL Y-1031 F-60-10) TaxID=1206466 RepID=K0KVT7_WICCF|nr:uncharacterized protein BN7_5192 [Wickerhamomyces ciferrii]CCH45609.1 hypothetical protein BN7_5192 [Wickerhamomyces ciferrii]